MADLADWLLMDGYAAKVQRFNTQAKVPTQAYPGDAGFDLYYCGDSVIQLRPDEIRHIPSHVAIQWPEGIWGFVIGRSSSFQRGILVNPTIIDAGFRGELFAFVRNIARDWVTIQPDERIAQIVPLPLMASGMELHEVNHLDPSERGQNGFGSSGR